MELSIQKGRPKALPFGSSGVAVAVLSLEVSVDMRSPWSSCCSAAGAALSESGSGHIAGVRGRALARQEMDRPLFAANRGHDMGQNAAECTGRAETGQLPAISL
jgi:hypothetical protein